MRNYRSAAWIVVILGVVLVVIWGRQLTLTSGNALAKEKQLQPEGNPFQQYSLELIAHLGGPILDIAYQGSYAYVLVGPRLVIFDVRDPAYPVIGQTDVQFTSPEKLALAGGYAYVVMANNFTDENEDYLSIVDVSDPANPHEVGQFTSLQDPYDVTVAGEYVYVPDDGDVVHILDVSTPSDPIEVGTINTTLGATSITVWGEQGYVTGFWDVKIYDLSDLVNPVLSGTYTWEPGDTQRRPWAVAVQGNYAYVAYGPDGLRILNVQDPVNPVEVGAYQDSASGDYRDVIVVDHLAYVDTNDLGIAILDITNPTSPVRISPLEIPTWSEDFVVNAGYLYSAAMESMDIFNITNPTQPAQTGIYNTLSEFNEVKIQDGFAYIAAGWGGLRAVQLASGAVSPPYALLPDNNWFYFNQLEVVDNKAYVYDNGYVPGLHIIDVANPMSHVELGFYLVNNYTIFRVIVDDPYVYLIGRTTAGGPNLVRVLDVSNPAQPALVTDYLYDLPFGLIYDATLIGDHLYISEAYETEDTILHPQLHAISVADPTALVEVFIWERPVGNLVVEENLLFTTGYILDISDPTNPVEVGSYTSECADLREIEGSYAYCFGRNEQTGYEQILVFDFTNPASAVQLDSYERAWDVGVDDATLVVDDGLLYVGNFYSGFYTFWLAPMAAAVVSETGGDLTSPGDQTTYHFVAGTFTQTVTVTHTAVFPSNAPSDGELFGIGHVFENTAESIGSFPVQPTQPYALTIQYTDAERRAAIEETLALYFWDGTTWVKETSSEVNTATNTLTATPDHFGLWAVFGETHQSFLPMILPANSP